MKKTLDINLEASKRFGSSLIYQEGIYLKIYPINGRTSDLCVSIGQNWEQ